MLFAWDPNMLMQQHTTWLDGTFFFHSTSFHHMCRCLGNATKTELTAILLVTLSKYMENNVITYKNGVKYNKNNLHIDP